MRDVGQVQQLVGQGEELGDEEKEWSGEAMGEEPREEVMEGARRWG